MTPDEDLEPRRLMAASLTRSLTAEEQAALEAWSAASAEAREEISRTREAWLALGLAADAPAVRAMRQEARRQARLDRPARADRRAVVAGLGLLAAAVVVGALISRQPSIQTYEAPPHASARLTLADGSHVVLSPGGRMTTRFRRQARDVSLDAGDAFFAVAHDRSRPFAVTTAGRTLTVLGTRFNVAGGRRLTVSLVEGSLRVSEPGAPSMLLRPGERYTGAARAGGAVERADVRGDAAWTDGRVVLTDASLAQAAERLSRASGRQVTLSDPSLTRLRLSGSLDVGRMDDVGVALEALLPVRARVTKRGDLIVSPSSKPSRHG